MNIEFNNKDSGAAMTNIKPGQGQSLWLATTRSTNYTALSEDLSVDAAVLGGGIAGITSALLLTEAGLKVALIEAGRIAGGISAHTAGKITSLQQLLYSHLISTFGLEKAQMYAEANQAAIHQIEAWVKKYNIACDFLPRSAYTYAESQKARLLVEEEVKAALDLQLPASLVEEVPLPFSTLGAIRFSGQAQFHPRKYLLDLADRITAHGGRIFELTPAVEIEEGEPITVITSRGKITAKEVIICTHTPFYDKDGFFKANLFPVRSYMIAIKTKEPFSPGMYIGSDDFGHSLRSQQNGQTEAVLIGGEDHPLEQAGNVNHHQELINFASKVYDSPILEYRWAGFYNNTFDRVPYIGRYSSSNKHLFVATGFGGWGMTNGTAAGMIFRDLILQGFSPWTPVYDPNRAR
jgi:glycine/D-amino acid oxidase-like deaminating enzyme